MDHLPEVLDLSIVFTKPPPNSSPEILASVALQCEALRLDYAGNVFTDLLTQHERDDLRWYLEEYWKWPYLEFAKRGKQVEALLGEVGKRFYRALFGRSETQKIVQAWQQQVNVQHQISIISEIASILRLPWELLSDQDGFLVLHADHPVSIVRRLPTGDEQVSSLTTSFQPPLRVLLVTARPEGAGFVDPRSISHELVDELQMQSEVGNIELEFLRPPTLKALRTRLQDTKKPPIHVLHFDGHGGLGGEKQQGILLFETEGGNRSFVEASHLAKVLQNSGVRLAVLTACQSAMDTRDDALSSVSTQLISNGVDAVIAMSSSILVTSAARYVEAFYHAIAEGLAMSVAHEQARQALQKDPYRHPFHRHQDEEATRVKLSDWWVPHFYQQSPALFQLAPSNSTNRQPLQMPPVRLLSNEMPPGPRYGFSGRARELQQIERHLLQGKVVVLHGFGGIGKTALAREAADWLTRTGMYQGACFVSFEGGRGSATSLLSQLGFFLGVYDGTNRPDDPKVALQHLKIPLTTRRTLVIADNLESILPGGEAPLEASERTELWNVLLSLQRLGAGVLLTSRDPLASEALLSANAQVVHLPLRGLHPDDAYALATQRLEYLGIPHIRVPYADLRDLLQQLDHHPLAIQLALPTLQEHSLAQIRSDFAKLLHSVTDDTVTGRNRSLLASLDYSLRRLTKEQCALLHRLAVFEGGAMENRLIEITEIAEADWAELRPALEQAALLTVEWLEEGFYVPYLHFHPVLIPFLRGQSEPQDEALELRYAQQYYEISEDYYQGDNYYPIQIRAVVQRELPNLRRALGWLLESGDLEKAAEMVMNIERFLNLFGLHREQQQMHSRVAEALATQKQSFTGTLTRAEYLHENILGEEEKRKGHFQEARARYQRLLAHIESQPEGSFGGPGSFEHATILGHLGRCLWASGNYASAEPLHRRAIALIEALLQHYPENRLLLLQQSAMLADLGEVLLRQEQYTEAKQAHEQALQIDERLGDPRGQAVSRVQLETIALQQGDDPEARIRYQQALETFHALGEPTSEAIAWHQLGTVAGKEQNWSEAERSLRESLRLYEQLGDRVGAAGTCNSLGVVAQSTNRFAEAKGWFQHAIELGQEADTTSDDHVLFLSNLAKCLIREVRAGTVREVSFQLEEARRYAEQALEIEQILRSPKLWETFSLLATIAEMQGRSEAGRAYHRQEKEGYASLASHRDQIDQQFGTLFPALATALDSLAVRALMEESLSQLEAAGWHISETIQRIWAGERDWQTLVENLNNQEALFVLRVLETLTILPPTVRETLAKEDQQAFQQAFDALSTQEQQVVMGAIQALQERMLATLVPTVREMLETLAKGDRQAFQQTFDALSTQEQQVVMGAIQALQREQGDDEEKSSS